MTSTTRITLLHFNDVYRITPQKVHGSEQTIDVAKFATLLQKSKPLNEECLVLFSGDLFSPSVESSVTRGSHLVPVMNLLNPDVALTGNHDFDFGFPHLSKLVQDSTYPWILSNVVDKNRDNLVPEPLKEFVVLERGSIRFGIIGLVEKDWIETVSSWPENFLWIDMVETGQKLSKLLRDPNGPYRCDIIIALTHCRLPNDIRLAKSLNARPGKRNSSIASTHGVDILLGGHDHMYYASKGCERWQNFQVGQETLGGEEDDGVLLIKSGTDFRDLSSIELELESMTETSVRRKIISIVQGKRLATDPSDQSLPEMRDLVDRLLSSVTNSLQSPLCDTLTALDLRSALIRTQESAACNWFADVLRHAYDDSILSQGYKEADGALVGAGTFRGDSCYGPGIVHLGDILEILPFEDPMVVIEIDGAGLWNVMEAALEAWPSQEGRFPVISGFRVEWDSSCPPGQRVKGIWKQDPPENSDDEDDDSAKASSFAIDKKPGGRLYALVTREYMTSGHDGFRALVGRRFLVDHESGQLYSSIVRRYLLGSHFIGTTRNNTGMESTVLNVSTKDIIRRRNSKAQDMWHKAAVPALAFGNRKRSKSHYRESMATANKEHMSEVDCFDGCAARQGEGKKDRENDSTKLGDISEKMTITPIVDGRMRDLAR